MTQEPNWKALQAIAARLDNGEPLTPAVVAEAKRAVNGFTPALEFLSLYKKP